MIATRKPLLIIDGLLIKQRVELTIIYLSAAPFSFSHPNKKLVITFLVFFFLNRCNRLHIYGTLIFNFKKIAQTRRTKQKMWTGPAWI
jgi:hypothetical protein